MHVAVAATLCLLFCESTSFSGFIHFVCILHSHFYSWFLFFLVSELTDQISSLTFVVEWHSCCTLPCGCKQNALHKFALNIHVCTVNWSSCVCMWLWFPTTDQRYVPGLSAQCMLGWAPTSCTHRIRRYRGGVDIFYANKWAIVSPVQQGPVQKYTSHLY